MILTVKNTRENVMKANIILITVVFATYFLVKDLSRETSLTVRVPRPRSVKTPKIAVSASAVCIIPNPRGPR